MSDLHTLTASEAARCIASGEVSTAELTEACLARIRERDDTVGAWQAVDGERVLAVAAERDRQGPTGPLHGIPVGFKDIIDTADLPTERGSAIYAGRRPAEDADVVARTRHTGGLVLGKTVTTEFALYQPGKTANPLDPGRTPGGSSSGSAAAVADCMVPLAYGTQTAGSVIRPAAFCGIYGFKPTHGVLDYRGVNMISSTLDTLGLFARSVEDVELAFAALTAPLIPPWGSGRGAALPPEGNVARRLRIGFTRTHEWEQAEAYTRSGLEGAAADLEAAGAQVDEVTLPPPFAGLVDAQQRIMDAEAAHWLRVEYREHADDMSESACALVERGRTVPAPDYVAAIELARACRAQLRALFTHYDALLAPSTVGEAPEGLDATGDPLFCRIWTLLGVPALNVPFLRGPNGMPVGMQLIGPAHGERGLLAVGRWAAERLDADPHRPGSGRQ